MTPLWSCHPQFGPYHFWCKIRAAIVARKVLFLLKTAGTRRPVICTLTASLGENDALIYTLFGNRRQSPPPQERSSSFSKTRMLGLPSRTKLRWKA